MRFLIAPVLLALLAAGCTPEVTGSGSATGLPETTTPETTTTTTAAALDGVPPERYEGMPSQYCEQPFTGALGKQMLAVVVETPQGRLNCDQAGAVLFDYYAQRAEPKTGLPPIDIGPLSCNQVAEGIMPQVVCADGENVIYSMWPQT
ncbi:hypothetical protein SAMN05660733_00561 [Lentzea albidocapillata]|uniref:Subtilisin inhibitor-like n=1 Tax=Lentzea albidocapillata TaxID=40571 RepID=A0A1W2AD26_9PSEU|nr:hypothetical protein [Lentzea albidocapillata]SMC58148.1 hypothetical protein SAMN05660733_00561 [Lentzea albidocapillata]